MSFFLLNQLAGERADQAAAVGVLVEVCSADEAGEDPKGKSTQAEPGGRLSLLKIILQTPANL